MHEPDKIRRNGQSQRRMVSAGKGQTFLNQDTISENGRSQKTPEGLASGEKVRQDIILSHNKNFQLYLSLF